MRRFAAIFATERSTVKLHQHSWCDGCTVTMHLRFIEAQRSKLQVTVVKSRLHGAEVVLGIQGHVLAGQVPFTLAIGT